MSIHQFMKLFSLKNQALTPIMLLGKLSNAYIKNSWLGLMPLNEITKNDLMKYYKEKMESGKIHTRKKEGLGIRSVNYLRMLIQGAFVLAHNRGEISKNVHAEIKKFKKNKTETISIEEIVKRNEKRQEIEAYEENENKKMKAMTEKELNKFLEEAREYRYYMFFTLIANTGLRKGEASALTWKDIDFENRTINIKRSLARIDKEEYNKESKNKKVPYIKSTKRFASNRVIKISPQLIDALKEHKELQKKEKKEYKALYEDRNLVFCTEIGNFICSTGILDVFHKIEKQAGLKGFCIHSLRHTFCSLLISKNPTINPKLVQEIMGHSSITVTLDVYGTLFNDKKLEFMDELLNVAYM